MNHLDHVVLAAPDLDAARAAFLERTGVAPVDGGPHVGLGTRNALVSFGAGCYLEIIAPDPAQSLDGTFGERLAALTEWRLLHWAVRAEGLAAVAARAREAGFEPGATLGMMRELPGGGHLEWELMGIGGHDLGGIVPFYIDWLDCTHPAETSPVVGELAAFRVATPKDSALAKFLDPAPEGVEVIAGDTALTLEFGSPKGRVAFTEAAPMGFAL